MNTTPSGGALRSGNWKIVVKTGMDDDPDGAPAKKKNAKSSVELYDLAKDPYEKENVAEANAEVVKQLRTKYDVFAKAAVAPKAKPKAAGFVTPKVWGEK